MLSAAGVHVQDLEKKNLEDATFVLGDHDGFSKPVKKFLRKNIKRLSLGPQIYFTSQAITILNYELDNL
jgi:tRNA pseudouridine-54 N-methylase